MSDRTSIYRQHTREFNRMINSGQSLSGRERNCAFLNTGAAQFVTASAVTGFDFADDARGIAVTDWDRDGRLDAWVSGRTAPHVRFLRNEGKGGGDWITVRLTGGGRINRDAIGTRVEVRFADGTVMVRTLRAGDSFLSQSDKLLHFGLGAGEGTVELAVRWPDGTGRVLTGLQRNAHYRIAATGEASATRAGRASVKWESGGPLQAVPFSSEGSMRLVYPVPLPDLTLVGADGAATVLGPPGEGRFRLLNLWNPGCAGCEEELTELTAQAAALDAAKVEVVAALGPGEAGMEDAVVMLRKIGAPCRFGQLSENDAILLDTIVDATFLMARNLVLPTSFLIGSDGKLEVIYLGAVPVESLLKDVALLRGKAVTALERATRLYGDGGRWLGVAPQTNLMYVPLKLMDQRRVADAAAYVRSWAPLLSASKEYGRLLVWIADEKNKAGETQEAMVFYLNALNQGSQDPLVMNNVAWQLATHRDPRMRNGGEAVKWAEKAVSLTGRSNPSYLDTLAAAYAETGDFPRALATVDEALRLARNQKIGDLVPGLLKARQSYSGGVPLRDGS